jgi:catechol 2,3-dioxygenase-like lactoylglutathione lyase family enzyme
MPDPLDALRLPLIPVAPRPEFANALLRRMQSQVAMPDRQTATVRYFVDELDGAVAFYRDRLGFEVELIAAPGFAMLYHGDLRLLLSVPGGSHILPDGTAPEPGGWNRITLHVTDLDAAVESLRSAGVRLRTDIIVSPAIRQALVEDPSGNLIELFEPLARYHERARDSTRQRPIAQP